MEHDNLMALGRIEGKLDMIVAHLAKQDKKLEELDGRLRDVEVQAARSGAMSGALSALAVTLLGEFLKRLLH
ncbi:hypothetical protein JOS77_11315 [Chromobacterium haemolyticum]|uniref:Uncharacterized protein n=1 Tax=Chromobacterium haemolyticum TaxID=394935 RepID=A0A1W0CQ22_9NEIS|nr:MULTISPECIES: hypothetical protein [Chromobacterium]OQS35315.1 hypothetical protein B0T39_18280 [Chromobacterium haemolyticum]OQS36894.1 hypothetical protein B0T45_15515 [Chromobacterium haemolyticum]QOZ82252.1 hypothetical protein DXT74_03735 [Chromobacterium sp. Rain0013]UGA39918.1 hypothetical protein JOS77_11315 [Chromobacterium haemolyticum]WON82286.1 hypothetical protein OK026_14105 [Chromobacterium haemolyticum]